MKKLVIVLFALGLTQCKSEVKKEDSVASSETPEMSKKSMADYPDELVKVLDAHGGMDSWKQKRTLVYEMEKPDFTETHVIDLHTRKDRIDVGDVSMGFDGEQPWLLDTEKGFKGDVAFYHNLMFYFYAMPFVLADDGIVYGETEDLVFEDKSYPGIAIAYESGVGTSSKDEYFIHYDPETNQMAWLGYTVTYRTGEKSEKISWIRYNDWNTIDGVALPNTITWYKVEEGKLIEPRNTRAFSNASLSVDARPDSFYAKPEGGNFVTVNKS